MEKLFRYLSFLSFLIYWVLTFVYLSPNNYIRIQFSGLIEMMDTFFFQRWNFFAPPPTSNNSLYYIFTDSSNIKYEFEVISPILDGKRQFAPFNTAYEYLDYTLHHSIANINDMVRDQIAYLEVTKPGYFQEEYLDSSISIINANYQEYASFQTIINYADIIRKKKLNDVNIKTVQFVITAAPLPKFKDRNEIGLPLKENLIFQSNVINLNP